MARDDRRVHRRFEDRGAALAGRLGRVHRDVGVPQQLVRVLAHPAGNGDADAPPDRDLLAPDRERHLQRVDHPFRDCQGALELHLVRQEDRELVAAEPGRQVVGSHAAADPVGHGRQQPVAGRVAEGVVDDLEVVEVEEEDDRAEPFPAER